MELFFNLKLIQVWIHKFNNNESNTNSSQYDMRIEEFSTK